MNIKFISSFITCITLSILLIACGATKQIVKQETIKVPKSRFLTAELSKNIDTMSGSSDNPTDSFSPEDPFVYAYIKFENVRGDHKLRWDWYAPDGTLYYSTGDYPLTTKKDRYKKEANLWHKLSIKGDKAENLLGDWKVNIFSDGELIASNKFVIEEKIEGSPLPREAITPINWYKKQRALIIGIDRYQNPNISILNNARRDAETMSGIFQGMGFKVTTFLDDEATKKNIIGEIKRIKAELGEDDGFLLYFAGHGQALKPIHTPVRKGYILPYDANVDLENNSIIDYEEETISLDQLKTYAFDVPAKHVALLIDSCFSGLAFESRSVMVNRGKTKGETQKYYEALLRNKTVNILTAGDDQPVDDGSGHSPFARAIMLALDKGNVDLGDGDGYATFSELAVYVKKKVEKITGRKQRPQFKNFSEDDGDFIFKLKKMK